MAKLYGVLYQAFGATAFALMAVAVMAAVTPVAQADGPGGTVGTGATESCQPPTSNQCGTAVNATNCNGWGCCFNATRSCYGVWDTSRTPSCYCP